MGKLVYKIDVMKALKERGYSSYVLRGGEVLSSATQQKIRRGEIVNAANIEKLCEMLQCQPGDLLEYIPDPAGDDAQQNGGEA